MSSNNRAPARRDTLRVAATERPGWRAPDESIPVVGERVFCAEGEADVVRVLGRTSDGSRLLELHLRGGPTTPYFASSTNVLRRDEKGTGAPSVDAHEEMLSEPIPSPPAAHLIRDR